MTRKLLLPTARQRKQLARNQLHSDPDQRYKESTELISNEPVSAEASNDQGTQPASSGSIEEHNAHCEKAENNHRLKKWLDEQRVDDYLEVSESRDITAAMEEGSSTSGSLTPPPELPPRPVKKPGLALQTNPREALLQEIRDAGRSRAANQVASNTASKANTALPTATEDTISCHVIQQTAQLSRAATRPPTKARGSSVQNDSQGCTSCPDLSENARRPPPVPRRSRHLAVTSTVSQPPPSPPPSPPPVPDPVTRPAFHSFTSSCGNYVVDALLLDWRAGKVWLLKANGVKVAVPLSRFLGRDIEYILLEIAKRNDEKAPRESARCAKVLSEIGKGSLVEVLSQEAAIQVDVVQT
jgi:hypothetical protein